VIIEVANRCPPGYCGCVCPTVPIFLDIFVEFIPVEELSDSAFLFGLFVEESFMFTFADARKCN
jgi:hypothetical protein